MNNFKLNTNTIINGVQVQTIAGDIVNTRKGSELSDGGLLQPADSIIVTRGTGNYKILGSNIIATQNETDIGTNDTKAITPSKLRNSSLATSAQKGVTQLATATEYFNKDSTKTITPNDVANDIRIARFAVVNSGATGLSQVIATGTSYNLLTLLLEANEIQISNVSGGIIYKNTSNIVQSTILNQTSDILFLPSPLNTFNLSYVAYTIKVIFTVDTPIIANNLFANFTIALRTVTGNTKIASYDFSRGTQSAALAGRDYEALLKFYVNGDSDAIITGGLRLFLENKQSPESNVSITLTAINNVIIFKD